MRVHELDFRLLVMSAVFQTVILLPCKHVMLKDDDVVDY